MARAVGPRSGGSIPTSGSWRASFPLKAIVVPAILYLARRIVAPIPADRTRPFDVSGAIFSAVAMTIVVVGILQAQNSLLLMLGLLVVGGALFGCLSLHIRSLKRKGKQPLLSSPLFPKQPSNSAALTP